MAVNRSKRECGKVKWFDPDKGYGFIRPELGRRDIYVHRTGIQFSEKRPLEEGESVSYELVDEGRGPKAIKVKRLAA